MVALLADLFVSWLIPLSFFVDTFAYSFDGQVCTIPNDEHSTVQVESFLQVVKNNVGSALGIEAFHALRARWAGGEALTPCVVVC